jgi:hypothetical protein
MEPYQIFCSIILNQKVVFDDIDHENIFETIERSSFNTEETTTSLHNSNKRKQTISQQETTRSSTRQQDKKSRLS